MMRWISCGQISTVYFLELNFIIILLQDSFEIPRGEGAAGDIEMGNDWLRSGEIGLDKFFTQVQDIE